MNSDITTLIQTFSAENISAERKEVLAPLITYILDKQSKGQTIRLNFICTHNSRRSHLSQIWAQTMAYHFGIKNVFCYSGGTEATAMFPKIGETLSNQGFDILNLSETSNPVYAVKYAQNEHPIICFSKEYNHAFNPSGNYAAIVTCNSADEACPIVFGAEARFPVKYDDPKAFDHTALMDAKYAERSLQIGEEMWYVFGQV
ncbi:MAG: protein-tyrosine-phosphatase [Saprospiraceae bacterium]|nr:protein-tyrosine-phosphatase [Saprospiraceae bacterium]